MSHKGLTLKETVRRERIKRKEDIRKARELDKAIKLCVRAALEPPRKQTAFERAHGYGSWHGVSKPRVTAIRHMVVMAGYSMRVYQPAPPIEVHCKDKPTMYFDNMQSVASWALARYDLSKQESEDNADT